MVALDFRLAHGFRSGLEEKVSEQLAFLSILDCYEITKIPFLKPERHRNYTPDFLLPNGIVIETKGVFTIQDRQKHIWIKEQYPKLDLRFVFSNSKNKIRKGSRTTYADWCNKHNFKYADHLIPEKWIFEKGKGKIKNEICKSHTTKRKRNVRSTKHKKRAL